MKKAGAQIDPDKYMATVGMFDGVHRGHVFLLEKLAAEAAARGLKPMALTFSQHPMSLLHPEKSPRTLSTLSQRIEMMHTLGNIARIEVLETSPQLMSQTGADFIDNLHRHYGVEAFLMGFNNHIGSDRSDAAKLSSSSIPVITISSMPLAANVCSSSVRTAIAKGDISGAETILGHKWLYRGIVVHGKQLGRTIGFPTANIAPIEHSQLMPPAGVYAVDVTLPDGSIHRGMANIGHRPTIDAAGAPVSFEVNIFDCDADLYDTVLDIAFIGKLRDEQQFDSVESLRHQLEADREIARML